MLEFLLLVLICYRLSLLIAKEEGPFGIFQKLRVIAGAYDYGANGLPSSNLGRGISCPLCVGVWIALLLSFYYGQFFYVYWLAIAGGQAFLIGLRND